jgi:hypothetical protein
MPHRSTACSCSIHPSVRSFYSHADIVIAAEAIEAASDPVTANFRGREFRDNSQVVTREVIEHWKGPFKSGQRLTTKREAFAGNCTLPAEKGDVMLLYLSLAEPRVISMCSGSADLRRSLRDIPELYRLSGSGDGT